MEQMTITAKIQIVVDETDKVLLDETMSVYRNACNYVSDYVNITVRQSRQSGVARATCPD